MLNNVYSKHTFLLKKHGNVIQLQKSYDDVMSSYIGFKNLFAKLFDI